MARPIVLGNGEMHVGLNEFSEVHDFYYPYVGGENHAAANALQHKIGVWVDDTFSWLHDGTWTVAQRYLPDTLIAVSSWRNDGLGVLIESTDTVDSDQSAFLRTFHIVNLSDTARDIRLFMHQVFVISNSLSSDTARYIPQLDAISHHKGQRVFLISGRTGDATFDQHTVGMNGIQGYAGSYIDAEDGVLSGNNVEHGRVDSVVRFSLSLGAHDSGRVDYWCAAGKSLREATIIHKRIQKDGLLHRLLVTNEYWHKWIKPALVYADKLEPLHREPFLRSALIIKSQCDKRGALIASTDTTMLNWEKDSYVYCWPRDGAFSMWPLVRIGYVDEPLQFFHFCVRSLSNHGYLEHKYEPSTAVASSWHPYVLNGKPILPIQTDESAIVIFLFVQFWQRHKKTVPLAEFYDSLISPIANFLAGYTRSDGLPSASFDLWERLHRTSTYTTAVTYASLEAAALLADEMDQAEDALRWRTASENMKVAGQKLFVENGVLIKGIDADNNIDDTLDISSAYGALMFGYIDDETVVEATFHAISDKLASGEGLARFADDEYNRSDANSVGNPWFISSLWMAQYLLEKGDTHAAVKHIDWVISKALPTGVLAEQIDPTTNTSLSVVPLTWSHAELVSTLLDTIDRKTQ